MGSPCSAPASTAILLLTGVVFLGTLGSCDDAPEATRTAYPLRPGTRWVFTTFTDTVLSNVVVNGHVYAAISPGYSVLGGTPALVRMNDADQLVMPSDDGEEVLFDFGAPVGATWTFGPGMFPYTVHVLERDLQNVVVPAGEFSDCYYFHFDANGVTDADWMFVVCPETGVVLKSGGFGVHYELTDFSPRP
jgi:hypothetical protein